jgi:hypothetical protein
MSALWLYLEYNVLLEDMLDARNLVLSFALSERS